MFGHHPFRPISRAVEFVWVQPHEVVRRGCAAAHRATPNCTPGGSEPYFRGPRSGFFWQKHSVVDFCRVGTFSIETLAYEAVAIAVGNNLFP